MHNRFLCEIMFATVAEVLNFLPPGPINQWLISGGVKKILYLQVGFELGVTLWPTGYQMQTYCCTCIHFVAMYTHM